MQDIGYLLSFLFFVFLSVEFFSPSNTPIYLNGERDQIFIILRLKASAYKLWHWRGKKTKLDFVRYYLFQRCMAAGGDCQEGKQQQKEEEKINNNKQPSAVSHEKWPSKLKSEGVGLTTQRKKGYKEPFESFTRWSRPTNVYMDDTYLHSFNCI